MELFKKNRGVVHFVGIGGIGMSAIAYVLHKNGFHVQGSDIKESDSTKKLAMHNIRIYIGHRTENVHGADVLVVSSAISIDNAELQEAMRLNIPILHRSEMLAEIVALKNSIAIAGTHGKTTTTSLIATILNVAQLSPTVINGGVIDEYESNALVGNSNWAIIEADESDGSFCSLHPYISVITNIDLDHVDYFRDIESMQLAFAQFMNNTKFYGVNVVCVDDENVRAILKTSCKRKNITYAIDHPADVTACNIVQNARQCSFDVCVNHGASTESIAHLNGTSFVLNCTGKHNVLNALASIIVATMLDVAIITIQHSLASFRGVRRRFSEIGYCKKMMIIDDYAHHPAEVRATLESARLLAQGSPVVAVFQPHRYSRLAHFLHEFVETLALADRVLITPTYAASEVAQADAPSHKTLCDLLCANGVQASLANSVDDVRLILAECSGGVAVFMGAGDITYMAHECVQTVSHHKSAE